MKTTTKTRKVGLLVHADDLQVGNHYAVHGIKHRPTETHPILGQPFRIKAMDLPFIVGQLVSEPTHPPVTFDVRFLTFMKVSPDFVKAQTVSHVAGAD